MVKRGKKKSTSRRKSYARGSSLDAKIIENFVALQKLHTGLIERFDHLSKEISQLLALFETTAKTFTKNAALGEYEKDREFLDKIDKLLDQNKTLAKGLTLMEERLRERMYGIPYSEPRVNYNQPSQSIMENVEESMEPKA